MLKEFMFANVCSSFNATEEFPPPQKKKEKLKRSPQEEKMIIQHLCKRSWRQKKISRVIGSRNNAKQVFVGFVFTFVSIKQS